MSRSAIGMFVLLALTGLSNRGARAVEPEPAKRCKPEVLKPVESCATAFRGQVDTYLFSGDFKKILVLTEQKDTKFVALDNAKELANAHLARQPQPIRMALIVASFPCKQQMEEFAKKLGLRSAEAVLKETILDGKKRLPAFRFLGVNVQRRTLDPSGKPLTDYRPLDLNSDYKTWMRHSGMPFEAEDPHLAPIQVPGRTMPLLRLFQSSPNKSGYPRPESRLKTLPKALEALPNKLEERFDPFAADEGRKLIKAPADKIAALPDHGLFRVIDVTVEPGKRYQYRLQVRMANPNFGRKDVDKPETAADKELLSSWYPVPGEVVVPSEVNYYVVDEKHLAKKGRKPSEDDPRAEMWRKEPSRGQVIFQLQRWVETTPLDRNGEPIPVGAWAVADRVFVARGEYVGQTVKVDLPIWKYTADAFVLPAEERSKRIRGHAPLTGFHVNFGGEDEAAGETILVDFEGGRQACDQILANGNAAPLVDDSAIEVLMLSPDGRLLARNSAADAQSPERVQRRARWRERVEALRSR